MKKVSVIIPIHNSAQYIEQCIDSVINQTYKNLEIIIVDDKSTDDGIKIIKNKNDERIKIIELEDNGGAGIARNKGIENSTGDFICFIDSDDFWVLDKIERQLEFIEKNDYTFVYGGYEYLKKGRRRKAHVPKSIDYNGLLKNHSIFTSTVMLNMEKLKKDDIYMPDIRRGQDMATWWQILKKGITAYGITDTLAIYRVGNTSLSSNKFKAINRTWNLFKRENLPFIKRIYCFLCYMFNATKRRMSI